MFKSDVCSLVLYGKKYKWAVHVQPVSFKQIWAENIFHNSFYAAELYEGFVFILLGKVKCIRLVVFTVLHIMCISICCDLLTLVFNYVITLMQINLPSSACFLIWDFLAEKKNNCPFVQVGCDELHCSLKIIINGKNNNW